MRYSVVFMNGRSKKIWTASFRSKWKCWLAVSGITSKTNNMVKSPEGYWTKFPKDIYEVMLIPSKTWKYKKEIKAHNSLKHKF